jgi:hypothetical protein
MFHWLGNGWEVKAIIQKKCSKSKNIVHTFFWLLVMKGGPKYMPEGLHSQKTGLLN